MCTENQDTVALPFVFPLCDFYLRKSSCFYKSESEFLQRKVRNRKRRLCAPTLHFSLMFSQQKDNMEATALCIKLLIIVMMLLCEYDQKVYAASLNIDPNRAQFFVYESLTFYCEGVSYCEVVHESKGKMSSCNKTNKRTSTGSSCTVTNVYPDDSGEYWFDAGGGNKSNSVNITVTDGSVILEIPALPVMEGEAVTLTCRNKTTSSQTSADFYKDGVFISSSSTGNMIINSVSKSDEGLYKCSISGAGESAASRLTVRSRDCHKETMNPPSSSNPWIISTVVLAVLLVVVGLCHFVKGSWNRVVFPISSQTPASDSAGNETDRPVYYVLGMNETQQLEPAGSVPSAVTNPTLTEVAIYSVVN
uniref:Ig-like domain-containing protein n=1 Tax=Anabas testudineus TaxID=64144 RepID=A0AAQ6ICC0_ANATE